MLTLITSIGDPMAMTGGTMGLILIIALIIGIDALIALINPSAIGIDSLIASINPSAIGIDSPIAPISLSATGKDGHMVPVSLFVVLGPNLDTGASHAKRKPCARVSLEFSLHSWQAIVCAYPALYHRFVFP